MRILDQGLNLQSIDKNYKSFVRSIQKLLGKTDKELSKLFGYNEFEFQQIMHYRKSFSLQHFQRFLDAINVDLEAIHNNAIDYTTLLQQYKQDEFYVPEYYSKGANGKKRTVINILDYVEKLKGTNYKILLLRKFQMRPFHMFNPDEKINNNFIVDLLEMLSESGFSRRQIIAMGEESFNSNKNTLMGKHFEKYESPQELMQGIFIDNIEMFDQNFKYQIKSLNRDICRLEVKQNKDVAASLGKKKIGSKNLSIYKMGVMASFPRYVGMHNAKVKLLHCAHEGRSSCLYEIHFSKQQQRLSNSFLLQ